MTDIRTELNKVFPDDQIKQLRKGGTSLDYVPIAEVIARLNSVLGTENWGESFAEAHRDQADPDWIVAKVGIWANIDGEHTNKIGYGGQKIKRTKAGDIVDLGDEFKGAHSDAFKKACTKLGVALHLARDESAMRQEAHDEEVRERAESPAASADVKELIKTTIEGLEDTAKKELGRQWKAAELPRAESDDFTQAHAQLAAAWLDIKLPEDG